MPSIDDVLSMAIAHQRAGRLAQAEQLCRRVLDQAPRHAKALHLLGFIKLCQRQHDEAVEVLREAVAVAPREATLHNDLGEALRAAGQFDQALACYKRSIQLNPNLGTTQFNLGRMLRIKGDRAGALVHLRRAIELEPEHIDAHHNLGWVLLARGDFEQGWQEFAWRTRAPDYPRSRSKSPRWDGSLLPGKRLEVHAEQGFGDTLQFIRYLPLVEPRAGEVVAVVHPELIPLLVCSGFHNLAPSSDEAGACDVQIPLLDLPMLLNTTLETIPADVPYLHADPARLELWRTRLPRSDGLRVGIAWQGNKQYYLDRFRSIPLAAFEPVAKAAGVQLFSLHKASEAEQLGGLAQAWDIVEFGEALDAEGGAFMDTAAIMKQLDLVITSDTSIVHLAGGLGVPVWVALGGAPDWRWMLERSDSPWYPTMRLFRASRAGEWSDVFGTIADELARFKQDLRK